MCRYLCIIHPLDFLGSEAGNHRDRFYPFYGFVRKNTKHLKKSLGMPLYKGGERGLSVWQDLTETYQTLNLDT